jgi:hypothetical protein
MNNGEYYLDILRRIDEQSTSVNSWEAGFIESILKRNLKYFTEKQAAVIEKMKDKYLSGFVFQEYPDDPDDDIPY